MDDWYATYFDEDYLRLYGPRFTEERTAGEVDGIVAALELEPGAEILDLCCGQGRIAVPLARRGYRVTGLDLSAYLLDQAGTRARAAGVEVAFHEGDMRAIPWTERFDAVINIFSAFGYFEDEAENEKVLAGVHAALKPGGRFLIEMMHRDRLARIFQARNWERLEDGTLVWYEREFDAVRGVNTQRTTFLTPDGRTGRRAHRVRVYTPTELVSMLRAAGLETVAVLDGADGSPFTMQARRLMVVAAKPGPDLRAPRPA